MTKQLNLTNLRTNFAAAVEEEGLTEQLEKPVTGYRIHWRSLSTGATGQEKWVFPKSLAEQRRDGLDVKYAGYHVHWIEPAEAVQP